jgi:SAM-dependent methyltransferase
MKTDVNLWTVPEHAQEYLEKRRDIPYRQQAYAALIEFLPASPKRALDLGTGDGYVIGLLRTVVPDVECTGIDFSPEMLRRAHEQYDEVEGVEILEHDLDQPLPRSLSQVDVIVSAFAIHHLHDQRKRALYEEVFAHLVPGGTFLNLEHVDSPTPELHAAFLEAIGKPEDDPSNKLASVETQLGWLREIGFEQVDCHWKWREMALLVGRRPT